MIKVDAILRNAVVKLRNRTHIAVPGRVSVVVPVYNSEASLPLLVRRITRRSGPSLLEIVFVNDGSRDDSGQSCGGSRDGSAIQAVSLMQPQAAGALLGAFSSRGKITVTLDDDSSIAERRSSSSPSSAAGTTSCTGRPRVYRTPMLRNVAA